MASESNVQKDIWKALGMISRLFRLNTGKGWVSNLGPKGVQWMADGSLRIQAPRPMPLGFGMPNGNPVVGACDLPGWTEVVITPSMVGCKVAVFTSMETKRTSGGRTSPDQMNWQGQVTAAGGIAGVVSSAQEAVALVKSYHPPLV